MALNAEQRMVRMLSMTRTVWVAWNPRGERRDKCTPDIIVQAQLGKLQIGDFSRKSSGVIGVILGIGATAVKS